MAVQSLAVARPGPHQHWVRRFGHIVVMVFSVLFAVVSGCSIGWYYSTLNDVSSYQWVVTYLIAIAFSGFGFFLSRSLAYCMHHKNTPKGVKVIVVLCVIFFEVVELSACFSEAAYGIKTGMAWLNMDFDPALGFVLHMLPFVVLPIFPVFTILCGQLDIVFDLQNSSVPAVQSQPVAPAANSVAPLPTSATRYKPPSVPQGVGGTIPKSVPPAVGSGVQGVSYPTSSAYQPKAVSSAALPPVAGTPPAAPSGSVPGVPQPQSVPVDPNATRVLPGPVGAGQFPASMGQPVVTDALSSQMGASDDATLITTSQGVGGSWLSNVPFFGRRQKDLQESTVSG